MLTIKKINDLTQLKALKSAYFSVATAPLDDMWHSGFVPMSEHFGFYENQALVGFCCVNSDGYLLQFYVLPTCHVHSKELFTLIAQNNSSVMPEVKGAFVSTAEPAYLSLVLDNSSSFNINALMYQEHSKNEVEASDFSMALATSEQLNECVAFAHQSIGAPEGWLSMYFANLIKKKALFGYWLDGNLVATGECRLTSELQKEYASLGMIVAPQERGNGIATKILKWLKNYANNKGFIAICSTESGNIAAQKAIEKAGFSSSNRIVQFEFTTL